MLALPDSRVWDLWTVDDGEKYHLFFLYASRALRDPDARHLRASIGHATSPDLVTWSRVEDALVRGDAPAFDDLATWTGSVVRHPDGTWFLFYTGGTRSPHGVVQSIGYATSPDLMAWTKSPDNPVLRADPSLYETLADGTWFDEAFRDPYLFADSDGNGWHMLITARAKHGAPDDRGVIGHATSPDLRAWALQPPLSTPGEGFAQLEVLQVVDTDPPTLAFSCLPSERAASADPVSDAGTWLARGASMTGPFDLGNGRPITGSDLYSGRLVRHRESGEWLLLAFRHDATASGFGTISDPVPITDQLFRATGTRGDGPAL
jgi:beta-fructofuranosidase